MNQVVDALRATAHPVSGIGGGRVDAWAAAHYLGLVPATPPAARDRRAPIAVPTSSRQVLLSTGVVRKRAVIRLQLAAGPLYLQLIGPGGAADCAMSFRAPGRSTSTCRASATSAASPPPSKAGSYPVTVRCRTANRKPY